MATSVVVFPCACLARISCGHFALKYAPVEATGGGGGRKNKGNEPTQWLWRPRAAKKPRHVMKLPMAATTRGRRVKTKNGVETTQLLWRSRGRQKMRWGKGALRRAKKTSALSVASENTHSEAGAFELQIIPTNASETRDRHELD